MCAQENISESLYNREKKNLLPSGFSVLLLNYYISCQAHLIFLHAKCKDQNSAIFLTLTQPSDLNEDSAPHCLASS